MGIPSGGVGSPPITTQPAPTTQPNPVPVATVANSTESSITTCCNGLAQCCDSITSCLTSVVDALSNWCSHCACSCECDSATSAHQRQQQPAATSAPAMAELRRLTDDVMTQQYQIHQTAVTGGDGFDHLGDEAGALGCAMSASGTSGTEAVTTQPQGGKESPPSKIKFSDSPPSEHKPVTCSEPPPSYDEATGSGGASDGHHTPGPLGTAEPLIEFSDSDDDCD